MGIIETLFGGGSELTPWQMSLRAAAVFVLALALIRVSGTRSFGQRRPYGCMDDSLALRGPQSRGRGRVALLGQDGCGDHPGAAPPTVLRTAAGARWWRRAGCVAPPTHPAPPITGRRGSARHRRLVQRSRP
jgi:hypothetical protein